MGKASNKYELADNMASHILKLLYDDFRNRNPGIVQSVSKELSSGEGLGLKYNCILATIYGKPVMIGLLLWTGNKIVCEVYAHEDGKVLEHIKKKITVDKIISIVRKYTMENNNE